jgi:hypothetical protein
MHDLPRVLDVDLLRKFNLPSKFEVSKLEGAFAFVGDKVINHVDRFEERFC